MRLLSSRVTGEGNFGIWQYIFRIFPFFLFVETVGPRWQNKSMRKIKMAWWMTAWKTILFMTSWEAVQSCYLLSARCYKIPVIAFVVVIRADRISAVGFCSFVHQLTFSLLFLLFNILYLCTSYTTAATSLLCCFFLIYMELKRSSNGGGKQRNITHTNGLELFVDFGCKIQATRRVFGFE